MVSKWSGVVLSGWVVALGIQPAEAQLRKLCDQSGCRMVDPRAPQPLPSKVKPERVKPQGYRGEPLAELEAAAANGDAVAAYKAGLVYAGGLAGVPADKRKGVRLLGIAAGKGNADAAYVAADALLAEYLAPVPLPPPPPSPAPPPPPEPQDVVIHSADAPPGAAPTRRSAATDVKTMQDTLAGAADDSAAAADAAAKDAAAEVAKEPAGPKTIAPEDASLAIRYLYMAAGAHVPEAEVLLGKLLLRGDLIPSDPAEAGRLFEAASEAGSGDAEYYIGQMHFRGTGRIQNGYEAIKWTRRAAKHGSVLAQRALGQLYLNGYENLKPDKQEAGRWLTAAAQNGDSDSGQLLRLMNEGRYVPKSEMMLALLPAGDIVRASDATLQSIELSRARLARGEPLAPVTVRWGGSADPSGGQGQTTVTPVPRAPGAEQCWQVGHVGREMGHEVRDEEIVCDSDIGIQNL